MIESHEQAVGVQQRRVSAGKKGRAKAVRRWFKRATGYPSPDTAAGNPAGDGLDGDFSGCRTHDEVMKEIYG